MCGNVKCFRLEPQDKKTKVSKHDARQFFSFLHVCTCHTGYIGDGKTCLGDSNKFPSMSRKVLYDQRGAIFIAALSIHTIPAIRSGK